MIVFRAFPVIGATMLLAMSPVYAQQAPSAAPSPVVDHHIHIQSSQVGDWLREMKAISPSDFSIISDDIFNERTGADAVRELDRAGIEQGVLLSTGYMFGLAAIPLPSEERARRMRAENRFNVDAAIASNGRLVAFVGINPFLANALEELDYWAGQPGASGVKLHLGNSNLDLADAEQVEQLAVFFAAASKARMPLVVHLRGAAPFTADGVRIFIDKVLSQAGDLPVQIAHGGGYGTIDPVTLDALAAYGDAIARKAPGTANLAFDMSAIMQVDSTAASEYKDPKETRSMPELRAAYVALMRTIGLDRFVLASDWPGLQPPAEYFAAEQRLLPVTADEWAQLCRNRAPYLKPEWTQKAQS